MLEMCYREYMEARGQRWEEREAFRRQFLRRHASMAVQYPVELYDLPSFASWFSAQVRSLQDAGEHVDDDVVQYGQPP